jgi:diaminohydroxyphosphoribosylaminopyrimidine deaminase / 5-amino-6-(5-phosphoribosylamino)uracil reductase
MTSTNAIDHPAGREQDPRFMQLALALGRRALGQAWPNPAVGALLVRDEGGAPVVVGRGWTQKGGRPHAETEALRRAGAAARGATLYVTLEPCSHHGKTPPCADAIIAAGIARVVSAIEDPNPEVAGQGHARLRASGIDVEVGLGGEEARRAHAGHISRVRLGRPHVMLKLAISADGKAARAGRRPVAITGHAARDAVHMLRAESDAIMTGIGTALADDPILTCRLPGMANRSPLRIVLDGMLRLPARARLAASAREVPLLIATGPEAPTGAKEALEAAGATVLSVPRSGERLDVAGVLRLLSARGISRVMVEAGPILAAALLDADLVDEVVLFQSDKVVGPDGIDALEGQPLTALTQSPRFVRIDSEAVGEDRCEIFERR